MSDLRDDPAFALIVELHDAMRHRLTDLGCRVEAIRRLALPTVTDDELSQMVAVVRVELEATMAEQHEAERATREWLASGGPAGRPRPS